MSVKNYWDFVNKLVTTLTLISVTGGVIWYFADLSGRVKILESQMQLLSVAQAGNEYFEVIKPVQETCLNLAKRMSISIGWHIKPDGSSELLDKNEKEDIEKTMKNLGCHLMHQRN